MENALKIFAGSLKHLKEHPVLFVPNCIYYTATYTLGVFFAALSYLALYYGFGYIVLTLLSIIFVIGSAFFSAFTTAGTIGMTKDVIEFDSTDLNYLLYYGKKYTLKLVIASVLITMIRGLSAFFWTPVIQRFTGSDYAMVDVMNALQTDPASLLPLFDILAVPALISLILTTLYFVLISFMFYFISYIIVIDHSSVYKSYRKSFSYLRKKPIQISSFVLIMLIFSLIPSILTGLLILYTPSSSIRPFFMILANIMFSILFISVTNVWITRFYIVLEKRASLEKI
ncbi:MAG: hypothetical protein FWH46_04330 [Methanimicrococcus sp.]|nr:hypothetical protein [Methanimicrococcus sp.]